MAKGYRAILFTTLALATVLLSGPATAGKLYQLDMCYFTDIPTYPAEITVNYYEGDKCQADKLKGSSSMMFEWLGNYGENWNFTHDDVAFLTSAWEVDGMLRICFTMNGHDSGKFKTTTSFDVVVNGVSSCLKDIHTSCSREIPTDVPLVGDGPGTFYINGGVGECLPQDPDCPEGDKVYELYGEFHVPLNGCMPGDIALNVYKDENDLKGTSTATYTGGGLDNIVCDSYACLGDAYMDGEFLVVNYEIFGWKGNGEFDSSISVELDLGDCGIFKLIKYHTSCSQIVLLNTPFWICPGQYDADDNADCGNGYMVLTGGCGACMVDVPIATQESNWSTFKSLY